MRGDSGLGLRKRVYFRGCHCFRRGLAVYYCSYRRMVGVCRDWSLQGLMQLVRTNRIGPVQSGSLHRRGAAPRTTVVLIVLLLAVSQNSSNWYKELCNATAASSGWSSPSPSSDIVSVRRRLRATRPRNTASVHRASESHNEVTISQVLHAPSPPHYAQDNVSCPPKVIY